MKLAKMSVTTTQQVNSIAYIEFLIAKFKRTYSPLVIPLLKSNSSHS